jgi:hypothetical protein
MSTLNSPTPLTYTVRGADGKQYGPVTLEQMSAWTREGRIQAGSEVQRSDMQHWSRAEHFEEFRSAFPPALPASQVAPTAPFVPDPSVVTRLRASGSWFYWVAALSLINSVVAFTGSEWKFIIGLGVTQMFDAIGSGAGGVGKGIVLLLDLVAAGVFVMFGVFANRGHLWAFIVGMVLFALDGLIFLLVQNWLGVGFHAFVLFCLFRGVVACRELKA